MGQPVAVTACFAGCRGKNKRKSKTNEMVRDRRGGVRKVWSGADLVVGKEEVGVSQVKPSEVK
jgi:hypothetical protein